MRILEVNSKKEMNKEVNNLVAMGYETKYMTESSAHLIKKKKLSIGVCICLFLFTVIGGIIYLIYCATREPQDDVLIKIEDKDEYAQGDYRQNQGDQYNTF